MKTGLDGSTGMPTAKEIRVREVWAHNLESEFELIRELVDQFPFVGMDTEFPGVVIRPPANFRHRSDCLYSTLKANVDALNLIQVGLTLSDERGRLPDLGDPSASFIWQFNFRDFDPSRDIYAPDSLAILERSGIDFARNLTDGVDSGRFAELLMSSGLVCNEAVCWVTFHSAYDFGYLLKLLTCQALPASRRDFLRLMSVYFCNVYDLKHLMRYTASLYGGLNRLAESLSIERRVGNCHQAGSDSLLTWEAFLRMKDDIFRGGMEKYAGVLYGLEGVCY
ncbi:probable CCR4-associated factor 1 homolog 9 [Nymphaea colorata]|uniref:poly(A)-specific ribonuclease n=1 Tax=Nymphaea colorata TaxID=210225 RepID=A0A5K0VC36_9MAGN|nr:probable CCR4-associated factor 1 homolog 9 [Nymphaea colorata]